MNGITRIVPVFFAVCFLFWSCDYGKLGGADQTGTHFPGDAVFEERMAFLDGVWYSQYAGIGRLDGYRVRKWGYLTGADKAETQTLFPGLNINNPETCSSKKIPQNGDYILLYNDTAYGQSDEGPSYSNGNRGFAYCGLVRAINIFNGDKDRGAIIIEYFEGCDPNWIRDENPFFGIYYRALSPNIVQMANAVDLAALYAGERYYTGKATLEEAVGANGAENEAEFISWGVVIPQERE